MSLRTFQRWVGDGDAVRADGRTTSGRPPPGNKLSEAERQQILEVANCAEFASLPPSQIVPRLADRGVYVASESSFYRVLRSASQQHHRGRARKPSGRVVTSHCATAPNQVWSWDITWIPAALKGQYYYWYMMLDVFSHALRMSVNFFVRHLHFTTTIIPRPPVDNDAVHSTRLWTAA
ncbi:transposase InsO family protein [Paraburkholderia fungorum]|nr:transposase InsO family protein [Paraburkholderia fungorum]